MSKKVIIIGAGIGGISAGYFARKSGYDTLILEQHTISGGICTSWKRKGYFIEGAIHWFVGSSEIEPIHQLWRELGAITDETKVYANDPFFVFKYKGQEIACYRNLDKFITQLLELSPEDEENIKLFRSDIEYFMKTPVYIEDLEGVKLRNKPEEHEAVAPFPKSMYRLFGQTSGEYGAQFKNEALQNFLNCIYEADCGSVAGLKTLGTIMNGDGGFIGGGSLPMIQRMTAKYESIGGKIQYSSKVSEIVTEGSRVKGVVVNGEMMEADAVIYAADLLNVNRFLKKPLCDEVFTNLEDKTLPFICTFVSLGVKADLSKYEHFICFGVEPFDCTGDTVEFLACNNYATYESFAPEGSTVLTFFVMQTKEGYEGWKKAKENGTYEEEKEKTAQNVIKEISKIIPEVEGNVDMIDVATPLTYERYTGAWKGSWMTKVPINQPIVRYPAKASDYENLYLVGERLRNPGGMSNSLRTARAAVQWLCRDDDTIFEN